jgi:hypothetical protein
MRSVSVMISVVLVTALLAAGCTTAPGGNPSPAVPPVTTLPPATTVTGTTVTPIPAPTGAPLPGDLLVDVAPAVYTPSMSSTVGIRVNALYGGSGVDSYQYRTNYGLFLSWDESTGHQVVSRGQGFISVNGSAYWSFPPGDTGPEKPSVDVTISALGPGNRTLAERHVFIAWQDNVTAVVVPEPCGIQNCHGPVLSCGPAPVEICTMEYQLGDKCRQRAACRVVNGSCRAVGFGGYDECVSCVAACANASGSDPVKAFECEGKC